MKSNVFAAAALMSAVATAAQTSCSTKSNPSQAVPMDNLVCNATTASTWIVQAGNTLNQISSETGAGVCDIARQNNITDINLINVDQKLIIPTDCNPTDNSTCFATPGGEPGVCVYNVYGNGSATYLITEGDTLSKISSDLDITMESLLHVNPQVTNPDVIGAGQILNLPVCEGKGCGVTSYAIQSGDTFFTIAQNLKAPVTVGLLKAINQGVDPTTLAINQEINIPILPTDGKCPGE